VTAGNSRQRSMAQPSAPAPKSRAWRMPPPYVRKAGTRRTAQEIVAALTLPPRPTTSSKPVRPLPITSLHRLPRDGSLLYGIGRVDASGRVADHDIVEALGWRHGDRLEVTVIPRTIVIRSSPEGLYSVPQRPCIVIPANARHHCGIKAGDNILLAAAPDFGIVIVHTLSVLDDMLAEFHIAHSAAPEQ